MKQITVKGAVRPLWSTVVLI